MVGDRIREARVQHLAFTQRELAQALEIESVNVSRWERGIAEPRLVHVRRIAELSGLPISWFFGETNGSNDNDSAAHLTGSTAESMTQGA